MSAGRIVGFTLALSSLFACGRGVRPINEEQRVRVLNAVEGLRQALNDGLCETVLDRKDWNEKCQHVRETWGEWRSFRPSYWYSSGSDAIAVEGTATFAKGDCVVQVVWDFQSREPRIAAFFLRSKEDAVDFPGMPPPRYVDPPRLRPEGRG